MNQHPDETPGGLRPEEPRAADESWKERALREKERLADELANEPAASSDLPPASFVGLIEELSVRAFLCMGQFVDPNSGQAYVDLPSAQYVIDVLEILQKKTEGNLEADEKSYLASVLHRLRLTYVEVSRLVEGQGRFADSDDEGRGGSIITPDQPRGEADPDEGAGAGPKIIV